MMAGGPRASEVGGPALGRGRDEDREARTLAMGDREPASQHLEAALSCFEVMSGKEGRTWGESVAGGGLQREG